jgi:hypothetical protein
MLSPNDKWYLREVIPDSVTTVGLVLRAAYGTGPDSFGSKGNLSHTSGYHRSREWVLNSPDSSYRSRDYSVVQGRDQGGDGRNVSAFDFTPGVWGTADNRAKMTLLTGRLVHAAQARDPRLADVREVAGTLDGRAVVTYDLGRQAFKTPFDSSHLDHVHVSLWRDGSGNDHSGVISVMLGEATMADSVLVTNMAARLSDLARGDLVTPKIPGSDIAGEENWAVKQLQLLAAIAADAHTAATREIPVVLSDEQLAKVGADILAALIPSLTTMVEQAVADVLTKGTDAIQH